MKYYNIETIQYTKEEKERIKQIAIENNIEYAIAYHDKDIKEDTGELKPPHYHIQLYSKIQKSINSWSKLLNIKSNMIEIIKYKQKAIQYLIHKNNQEKYQYKKEIIETNIDIEDYFYEKSNETKELKNLIEYIENKGLVNFRELLKYALENNIWSTYRRNYSILKDYIYEKNNLTREEISSKLKL